MAVGAGWAAVRGGEGEGNGAAHEPSVVRLPQLAVAVLVENCSNKTCGGDAVLLLKRLS